MIQRIAKPLQEDVAGREAEDGRQVIARAARVLRTLDLHIPG